MARKRCVAPAASAMASFCSLPIRISSNGVSVLSKKAPQEAGRDFSKIKVMSATAVWVSDDKKVARDRVRWFPALVSNHVVDLVSRYKPEELPPGTDDVYQRPAGLQLSASCRSRQQQCPIRNRRGRRPILYRRHGLRACAETAGVAVRRRDPIQHLFNVRRRRGHAGRVR